MKVRVLLTGARGFVGARIREALPVIEAPSLRNADRASIRRLLADTRPDVIVHTAAISDIGACDAQPEASRYANVDIPVIYDSYDRSLCCDKYRTYQPRLRCFRIFGVPDRASLHNQQVPAL